MLIPRTQNGRHYRNLHPEFPHPMGSKARILLTSVFGPYARDDAFGSRRINPMELYHNQVTRLQGPFSLRMFHRSWGLMLIQANVSAPCTLLDFPTLDRFVEEIRNRHYDIIGISSITMNILKVCHMCELVRRYQPEATIVVGGHIASIADLQDRLDADWIVREEGVRWFRRFLGEDPEQAIRHPVIPTRVGTRSLGITVKEKARETAVTLLPSVGCPLGCNFCSTSALFGGKGKWVNFYNSGDELFDILCQLESLRGTQSFFVMDENFLLYRRRALRLDYLCIQLGQCDPFLHNGAADRAGYFLGLGRIGVSTQPVWKASWRGYDGNGPGASIARHPRAGIHHHRPGTPHS